MTLSSQVGLGSQALLLKNGGCRIAFLYIRSGNILLLCPNGERGGLYTKYELPHSVESERISLATLQKVQFRMYGADPIGDTLAVSGVHANGHVLVVMNLTDEGSSRVESYHGTGKDLDVLWTDVDGVAYAGLLHPFDALVLHKQSLLMRNVVIVPSADGAKKLVESLRPESIM